MMEPSAYICERCWLPVRLWGRSYGGSYWKHSGGGGAGKSCGRTPIPVLRTTLDNVRGAHAG